MCVERFQVALRLSLLRLWPRRSFEAMVQIRVGCVRKNSFKKKGWSYDLASLRGEEVGSTNEILDFETKPTIKRHLRNKNYNKVGIQTPYILIAESFELFFF